MESGNTRDSEARPIPFLIAVSSTGESVAFFTALDLIPSLIISAVGYLLGYVGACLLRRLRPANQ
jgi:hypothetical protein